MTKIIEKKKSWSRMNKIEKRKAIAADVIANIKANTIVPRHAGYCRLNDNIFSGKTTSKKFQEKLKQPRSCQACAMGSMMAVDIMSRNNFNRAWEGEDIIKRFKGLFSELQLRLIETAFEKENIEDVDGKLRTGGINYSTWSYTLTDLGNKAVKLGKRFKNPSNRLIAIMNNIITSEKGLFLDVQ